MFVINGVAVNTKLSNRQCQLLYFVFCRTIAYAEKGGVRLDVWMVTTYVVRVAGFSRTFRLSGEYQETIDDSRMTGGDHLVGFVGISYARNDRSRS